ncbi:hypothetical protein CBL_08762 [Carabus blaptoides fortunei]
MSRAAFAVDVSRTTVIIYDKNSDNTVDNEGQYPYGKSNPNTKHVVKLFAFARRVYDNRENTRAQVNDWGKKNEILPPYTHPQAFMCPTSFKKDLVGEITPQEKREQRTHSSSYQKMKAISDAMARNNRTHATQMVLMSGYRIIMHIDRQELVTCTDPFRNGRWGKLLR